MSKAVDQRKKRLLDLVITNHIETSSPVGSNFLVEAGNLDVSGATVRNDMQELEEEGLIDQPHTSAGRVPTEEGYKFYVEEMMEAEEPKKEMKQEIKNLLSQEEVNNTDLKQAAKYAAETSEAAAIISFGLQDVYYTGLSKLFSQPEFENYDYTLYISQIFDRCEQEARNVYNLLNDDTKVMIGEDNPLGSRCSLVASEVEEKTMFMILGPMRMNYPKAVGFNQYLQEVNN